MTDVSKRAADTPATATTLPAASAAAPFDELTFTTAPNMLTLMRILFVPVVVGLMFLRQPRWDIAAMIAFAVASVTDYFDGYLARARKQVTVYGKLMDPLADKFLVVSALIMLEHIGRIHPVIVILAICRELAITGLRAVASAEGVVIPASGGGKWKTATQMIAIPLIMLDAGNGDAILGLPLGSVGLVLLYVSLALSLWSAKDYVVDFFRAFREAQKQKNRERRLLREARRQSRAARFAAKASGGDSHPHPPVSE